MDATEPQEPSYYEVALTNRQVLVAFVALLICLLVAFLSGVWIGRGGAEEAAAKIPPAAPASAAEAPIEQLSFFNGTEGAGGAKSTEPAAPAKPQPAAAAKPEGATPSPAAAGSPPAPAADASDAMRQNLEETMAANRETPAMKMAVGERTSQAPATAGSPPASSAPPAAQPAAKPAPAATAPAKPATAATAAAKPAATGKLFVQVYSSGNGQRAREIVANLRKAGFAVVISETPKANGKSFRVRVGPFADRAAADAAAIKLRRDHRLDTWVTDSP